MKQTNAQMSENVIERMRRVHEDLATGIDIAESLAPFTNGYRETVISANFRLAHDLAAISVDMLKGNVDAPEPRWSPPSADE